MSGRNLLVAASLVLIEAAGPSAAAAAPGALPLGTVEELRAAGFTVRDGEAGLGVGLSWPAGEHCLAAADAARLEDGAGRLLRALAVLDRLRDVIQDREVRVLLTVQQTPEEAEGDPDPECPLDPMAPPGLMIGIQEGAGLRGLPARRASSLWLLLRAAWPESLGSLPVPHEGVPATGVFVEVHGGPDLVEPQSGSLAVSALLPAGATVLVASPLEAPAAPASFEPYPTAKWILVGVGLVATSAAAAVRADAALAGHPNFGLATTDALFGAALVSAASATLLHWFVEGR